MSNFPFVADEILRSNLDQAFDHVVDLLGLSLSEQYYNKPLLVSSLRKTIIIHTASIIEALLLWKLKKYCKENKVALGGEWKYYDVKILHKIDISHEVIAGLRKFEEKIIDKLDFLRIIGYCYKYELIGSEKLKKEIDIVRELRNKLHLGGLSSLEKEYIEKDLEHCFLVMEKVKDLVKA
ncbi:MAG TPA: hypothetical protein VLG12_04645 [Candidatus Saccharimonadales bacterium]|nr:hypothetical protein [Candidatus Saccharimonadales bacterium]